MEKFKEILNSLKKVSSGQAFLMLVVVPGLLAWAMQIPANASYLMVFGFYALILMFYAAIFSAAEVFKNSSKIAVLIPFISPILNNYGFIAVGNREISRVYSAAPPCAPPVNVSELISSLLPTIFDDLAIENSDLSKPAIQGYITEKLITKAVNYPDLFKFSWDKLDFFENRLRFEINQFFLNICRSGNTDGKVEPLLARAREALSCFIVDLDDTVGEDGKATSFHDLIGSNTDEPLQTLLKAERINQENEALSRLTELQKSRLIEQYDASRRIQTGELFEVETAEAEPPVKPGNTKYRRLKPVPFEAQPQLFQGVAL